MFARPPPGRPALDCADEPPPRAFHPASHSLWVDAYPRLASTPMRTFVAIAMGLFSGLLLYMMAAMLVMDVTTSTGPSPAFVTIVLLGGWGVSAWLIRRHARSTSAVFRRGFLLGAAEWLAMAFVGLVFSSRAVASTAAQAGDSGAASAGAAIGGGLMAAVTGGFSLFMAIGCLAGFAVAYFLGREMRDATTTPTRKCPDCAEMIQAEARKCRHCGTTFVPTAAMPA